MWDSQQRQQCADRVIAHLAQQGRLCYDLDMQPLYRGKDGLMCGIGCLIPIGKYQPQWEHYSIPMNRDNADSPTLDRMESLLRVLGADWEDSEFLCRLQEIHDSAVMLLTRGWYQPNPEDIINHMTREAEKLYKRYDLEWKGWC